MIHPTDTQTVAPSSVDTRDVVLRMTIKDVIDVLYTFTDLYETDPDHFYYAPTVIEQIWEAIGGEQTMDAVVPGWRELKHQPRPPIHPDAA